MWEKINMILILFFSLGILAETIKRFRLKEKIWSKNKNLFICFYDLAEKKKKKGSHIKHLTFGWNFIQMPEKTHNFKECQLKKIKIEKNKSTFQRNLK